ncbi:ribosome silencing factor [Candidatus Mesenet endosymbiont of Agriotes lineatus]|uniref:ribosome silencing factor n=1 Tax=Candidatus Mesenet endosymbiont of Agriotes lineatus TaxID=3077948 RepID=UPI0030D183B4
MINAEELKDFLKDILEKNKGSNIAVFDVGKKTAFAKYMIIASGDSNRHVKSLAEYTIKALKQYGKINVEGMEEGNWVAVGFRDVIIHILRSDAREYYQIDELWNDVAL